MLTLLEDGKKPMTMLFNCPNSMIRDFPNGSTFTVHVAGLIYCGLLQRRPIVLNLVLG